MLSRETTGKLLMMLVPVGLTCCLALRATQGQPPTASTAALGCAWVAAGALVAFQLWRGHARAFVTVLLALVAAATGSAFLLARQDVWGLPGLALAVLGATLLIWGGRLVEPPARADAPAEALA